MAYIYPWVLTPVVEGVNDVEAADHNDLDEQIYWLTQFVNNLKEQKILSVQPAEINPGDPVEVLTRVALDTGKTLKVSIGASGLFNFTNINNTGPAGTGISTLLQRFASKTALEMGCLTSSGNKTAVKIIFYEDTEMVGWADIIVTIP